MKIPISQLNDYDLFLTHEIVLKNDRPTFKLLKKPTASKKPSVYVWAALNHNNGQYEVLYVGKAGKGVVRRNSQHQNGFINSGTGKKNAVALMSILVDVRAVIHVFTREAETIEIFGKKVSLYSAEEDALCAALSPILNREAFPLVGADNAADSGLLNTIKYLINCLFLELEEGTLDDMVAQIESYDISRQNTLLNILNFIETHLPNQKYISKLVKGYTSQLPNLNNTTVLVYGLSGTNGRMLKNSWIARVFFTNEPRLVFPITCLRVGMNNRVIQNKLTFSPSNIECFLAYPAKFLCLDDGLCRI
jgi:hypothetical protein